MNEDFEFVFNAISLSAVIVQRSYNGYVERFFGNFLEKLVVV
jgi:hypothetical protein